jgi:hypothetical protein
MKTKRTLFTLCLAGAAAAFAAAQTEPPIACNLRALTLEQRKQLSSLGDQALAAITQSRDLPDGYAFHIDPARFTIQDAAQLLDLWRKCCPFYEFRIDFHAADASMWLSITGRPGVKEFFPADAPRLAAKLPHAAPPHLER